MTDKQSYEVWNVVVPIPIPGTFCYINNNNLPVRPGQWVEVPIGKSRRVRGVALSLSNKNKINYALKPVLGILDKYPVIPDDLLDLGVWLSEYYLSPYYQIFDRFLPPGGNLSAGQEERYIILNRPRGEIYKFIERHSKKKKKQCVLLSELLEFDGELLPGELCKKASVSNTTLQSLIKSGLAGYRVKKTRKKALSDKILQMPEKPPVFTSEQKKAVGDFISAFKAGKRHFLLEGITGSGKTEVYMKLIEWNLKQKKKSILLVPEIALTIQMIQWIKKRLGVEMAVIHSGMKGSERTAEWQKCHDGRTDVVIGARSALFAPLSPIGLIILDEEHETSYKQSESPRYHTRDAARHRADYHKAALLLGSATPSMETIYLNKRKKMTRLVLEHRIDKRPLPPIQIVDMRKELRENNRSIFSRLLSQKMTEHLERDGQVILFLNRRGFSSTILCRRCGSSIRCSYCSVTMTYHRYSSVLSCHHCGNTISKPDRCPFCESTYIKSIGIGTERVEKEAQELFPDKRVRRLDHDSTLKRGALARILGDFHNGDIDILVGTQMLAKGLDIHGITLVGVVLADTSLSLPDFKSAERTFLLVSQVAGRAGRGKKPGEVILQTYMPEHPVFSALVKYDNDNFYTSELAVRKELQMPPVVRLARLILTGQDNDKTRTEIKKISEKIKKSAAEISGIVIAGPAPAPIVKIKNRYRYHLIVKSNNLDNIRNLFRGALKSYKPPKGLNRIIDIEPENLF